MFVRKRVFMQRFIGAQPRRWSASTLPVIGAITTSWTMYESMPSASQYGVVPGTVYPFLK